MLNIDVEAFVRKIDERIEREKNQSPDEAKAFLVKAGIVNKDGSDAIRIEFPHRYAIK